MVRSWSRGSPRTISPPTAPQPKPSTDSRIPVRPNIRVSIAVPPPARAHRAAASFGLDRVFATAAKGQRSPAADIFEIEHDAPDVRSHVLRVETELGAHLQHGRVFDQHVAIHEPQTFSFGVIYDALHQ